jgi:hypothetical protein
MSEGLKNFLVDLAVDPERLRRFTEDPGAEVERAGLTSDERAAVVSRDTARLRLALGKPDNETMTQFNGRLKKKKKKSTTQKKKKPAAIRKSSRKKG